MSDCRSLLGALLMSVAATSFGQDLASPQAQPDPRCRYEYDHAAMESMAWIVETGVVVEVREGDEIVFLSDRDHTRWRVHLVGTGTLELDAHARRQARETLAHFALNRHAQIVGNFHLPPRDKVEAVVAVSGGDMNYKMLQLGLVYYQAPGPYDLSKYTDCKYRIGARRPGVNYLPQ